MWSLEYRPDFNAVESGMDTFINWNKGFIGKEVTLKARKDGPDQRLVTMVINVDEIDVSNDEATLKDGQAVGYVSSGNFAHRVGQSLLMGYVKPVFVPVRASRATVESFYNSCLFCICVKPHFGFNIHLQSCGLPTI